MSGRRAQIILDLDATDDPLHGHQEGRFFHGYYDCYCYLPLYVFCGRHLLAAKLRRADIDASAGSVEEVARIVGQIRARWPYVRILLRADSGFAREELMAWCEQNRVDYLFGLARNARLVATIAAELARGESRGRDRPASRRAASRTSMEHARQLEPQAPRHRQGRVDARRGQSALHRHLAQAQRGRRAAALRGHLLRPRRHGEPHQGMPARSLRRPHLGRDHAGQPAAAVVRLDGLCAALRAASHRPRRNQFADATCGTIRLKLLKIGALVRISVRRIKIAMASACPAAEEWGRAARRLADAAKARASPA